ncbi:MAG: hypothetical protein ACI91R_001243, partial [Vicingaceae bacterium]
FKSRISCLYLSIGIKLQKKTESATAIASTKDYV